MTAVARFDLKMDANEKDVVSRAAALMGTTMAGFVRAAAKEKAMELLDRESRVTLSKRDFRALSGVLGRVCCAVGIMASYLRHFDHDLALGALAEVEVVS